MSLYIMLLRVGFSKKDIDSMDMTCINAFADAYADIGGDGGDTERWASQEDIDALFS